MRCNKYANVRFDTRPQLFWKHITFHVNIISVSSHEQPLTSPVRLCQNTQPQGRMPCSGKPLEKKWNVSRKEFYHVPNLSREWEYGSWLPLGRIIITAHLRCLRVLAPSFPFWLCSHFYSLLPIFSTWVLVVKLSMLGVSMFALNNLFQRSALRFCLCLRHLQDYRLLTITGGANIASSVACLLLCSGQWRSVLIYYIVLVQVLIYEFRSSKFNYFGPCMNVN